MNTERGFVRKAFDKAGLVFSVFTIPTEIVGLGTAIVTANPGGVLLFSGLLAMEHAQFTQHSKPPEQQSWYNPERIWDRVLGSLRFNKSSRLSYSENAAAVKSELADAA